MDITKFPEFDNHELISFFFDQKTGLRGYIAIHNTNRGPATGGTRYWAYNSDEEALRDALRLSRAMTYKCALAGVPYGGGKATIIADPKKPKTKEFLVQYAKRVNLLNGRYITGEDVGITLEDINILAKHSKFIAGSEKKGGDLGPWAALGVFSALKGALRVAFGSSEIKGKTFAVKGLGKVGMNLCEHIYKNGGSLVVANRGEEKIALAKKKFKGVKVVSKEEIHKQKCDVYSPCAMGNEFNEKNVRELNCKIICGGANNQLSSPKIGELIHKRKILYVPDYLANAGGLINVVSEVRGEGYNQKWAINKCRYIEKTTIKILSLAKKQGKPTNIVADKFAEGIFTKPSSN